MTICSFPGCNTLVLQGRCKRHDVTAANRDHERVRSQQRRRAGEFNATFYNSTEWRKLAKWQLSQEPLCRRCDSLGVTREATEVDHVHPISEGGGKLDVENLQSLCSSCHAQKTNAERWARTG